VISNNAPAQYGRGSAIVLMSSRSGTNQIHGTAFESIRLDTPGFQSDAKNYFAAPGTPLASLRQNQFGGSLGGTNPQEPPLLLCELPGDAPIPPYDAKPPGSHPCRAQRKLRRGARRYCREQSVYRPSLCQPNRSGERVGPSGAVFSRTQLQVL